MVFPDVELALIEPNGLLAIGGDLSTQRLISAYSKGIFPWFNDDQLILWWSPDPRMILSPNEIRLSRSLKKTLRKNLFRFSFDEAFDQVIFSCSQPRPKQPETWITQEMKLAYNQMHLKGYAHSFETWQGDNLVGGLYGVAIGKVFFGESMFSTVTDASKVAFALSVQCLKNWGYELIDCQVASEHLASFGAKNIDRQQFSQQLEELTIQQPSEKAWDNIEKEA
jgi:leucyl/phenylalanyl-tRNA--protein transferase